MKKEIGDKAAIAFSIGFYQGIAAGQSIDKAYNLGCIQIGMQTGMKQSVIPILIKKRWYSTFSDERTQAITTTGCFVWTLKLEKRG